MDLFGHSATSVRPFRDIRNTRPSAAEEKATLCLRIGALTQKAPSAVVNGSIQRTREWVSVAKAAKKTAGNSRASAHELTSAISNLERFEEKA